MMMENVARDKFGRTQVAIIAANDKEFPVYEGVNPVGRNKEAPVNIKNLSVSQNHAIVVILDNKHFVCDLNSSNGTFISDAKVQPFRLFQISDKSELKFGNVLATYCISTKVPSRCWEMSQNVTQNFYEASTQVFHDTTSFECTQGEEIHEALTQKVNLVEFKVPENPSGEDGEVADYKILNSLSSSGIIKPSTSRDGTMESTKRQSANTQNNVEVFCAQTQVVNLGAEGNSVFSCPTQDLGSFMEPIPELEDNENYVEVLQEKDTESDIHNMVTQEIDLKAFSKEADSSVKVASQKSEDTLKDTENRDESVVISVNRDNPDVNDDDGSDDDGSNDSVDFLKLEKSVTTSTTVNEEQPQPNGEEPQASDDDTDIEEFITHKPQEGPDSQTDAESQIGVKKKTPRVLQSSDSETDDESVIETKRKKIARIPPTQESEDSDILPMKRKTIRLPSTQEDSYVIETDSEAETSRKNLETSIPATQNMTLNDSCCILATQDTRAIDQVNGHVNSEESFKLGLTELMFDTSQGAGGGKTEELDQERLPTALLSNVAAQKVAEDQKEATEKNEDGTYTAQTQAESPLSEISQQDDAQNLAFAQRQTGKTGPNENNDTVARSMGDDLFLAPTQKIRPLKMSQLNKIIDSDLYSAPTQKLNNELSDATGSTGSNRVAEDNTAEIKDYIYVAQTQKICISKMSQLDDTSDSDLYLAATQKLDPVQVVTKSIDNDHLYFAQTQKIDTPSHSYDNAIYMQQTQRLPDDTGAQNHEPYKDDSIYFAPTQLCPVLSENQLSKKKFTFKNTPHPLDTSLSTILNCEVKSTSLELDLPLQQVFSSESSDRPTNPLSHILQENDDGAMADDLQKHDATREVHTEDQLKHPSDPKEDVVTTYSVKESEENPVRAENHFNQIDKEQKVTQAKSAPRNDVEDSKIEILKAEKHINKKPQGSAPKITKRRGRSQACGGAKVIEVVIKENADNKQDMVDHGDFKGFPKETEALKAGMSSERFSPVKENPVFHSKAKKKPEKITAPKARPKRKLSTVSGGSKVDEISDDKIGEIIIRKVPSRRKKLTTDNNKNDIGAEENAPTNRMLRREFSATSGATETDDHEVAIEKKKPSKTREMSAKTGGSDARSSRSKRNKIEVVDAPRSSGDCQGDSDMSQLEVSCDSEGSKIEERSHADEVSAVESSRRGAKGTRKTAPVSNTPNGRKGLRKRDAPEEVGSRNTSDTSGRSAELCMSTPKKQKLQPKEGIVNTAERNLRKQRPKVVFTMMDSPQMEAMIRQLGGSVVQSVESCTVLVTEQIKRSQKLLVAVGLTKPICSPSWITDSKRAGSFLDPWDYILRDLEAETKWDFSLEESLNRSMREKLFEDYTFQVMVTTAADVIKGAIEACGGRTVSRLPAKIGSNTFVICSPENRNRYQKMLKQHPDLKAIEPEAIFDGVLRQEWRFFRHYLT